MSKRHLSNGNNNDKNNIKKPRNDSNNGHYHQPLLGAQNRLQFENNLNQNNSKPSTSHQIPISRHQLPQPLSIQDLYDDNESDDEYLILASQKVEEEFSKQISASSTQRINIPNINNDKPIRIEHSTHNNFIVDSPSLLSQKENITAQQVKVKENEIKALNKHLSIVKRNFEDLKVEMNDMTQKVNTAKGEASNLRREKKILEDKIKTLQLKQYPSPILQQTIRDLETQLEFAKVQTTNKKASFTIPGSLNNTLSRNTSGEFKKIKNCFTINLPKQSLSKSLKTSKSIYEQEKFQCDPAKILNDCEILELVINMQLTFAKIQKETSTRIDISTSLINELITITSTVISSFFNYVNYLESEEDQEITFDACPKFSAIYSSAIPLFREKLTKFDSLSNALHNDEGFLSLYQADNLFKEEICSDYRRLLSIISVIARFSREFSEFLLTEKNVYHDAEGSVKCQNFVSILVDILEFKVAESNNVYDYYGIVMTASSLLSNLGFHYQHFNDSKGLNEILLRFFRVILSCRCDNAIVMKNLSEFLVNATKNFHRSDLIKNFCVDFPSCNVIKNEALKCCQYPEAACTFQLFFMYLLTAFKFTEELNNFELNLVAETTLNLNRITLNILQRESGIKFFNSENINKKDICSCLSMLLRSLLVLNYLTYTNSYKFSSFEKGNSVLLVKAEISRSFVIIVADLFKLFEDGEYPIDRLALANNLNHFCYLMKTESICSNKQKNLNCHEAYKWQSLHSNALVIVHFDPVIANDYENLMEVVDSESKLESLEIYNDLMKQEIKDNSPL
ncbi:CLUMA_CG014412, isoform A [Clunio marinus]|uniref:CLUMA_CG014412, isoform A n=1 Tax=Clunio marinus TaxID=568069 RepID=A0A1J1IML2_9DIPT|nr:CLUMA_CG014412, isoform A [Clunio marinus]